MLPGSGSTFPEVGTNPAKWSGSETLPKWSIYSGAFLEKMEKSSKWSHRTGKRRKTLLKPLKNCAFLGLWLLTFLNFFPKMRQTISTLLVILSFMKFFVAQISITRFFSNCWKAKKLRHIWINHPNFFIESSFSIHLQERNSNATTRKTSRTIYIALQGRQVTLKLKSNVRNHSNFE